MANLQLKIQKKYINDLIQFYNVRIQDLDNQHIRNYLLEQRIFPGTPGYEIIRDFFSRRSSRKHALFTWLELIFPAFLRATYRYYCHLNSTSLDGHIKIKMTRLITDLFCWCLLNDIQDLNQISEPLMKDYVTSNNFRLIHSHDEISILANAMVLYNAVQGIKKSITFNCSESLPDKNYFFLRKQILNEVCNYEINPEIKNILRLSLLTGISVSKILSLKYDDVNFFHQKISFTGLYSGHCLNVLFNQDIKKLLIRYIQKSFRSGYLIPVETKANTEKRLKFFKRQISFELANFRWSVSDIMILLEKYII